ncbi:zinc ribbon domain-containing protein [Rudaea sp.]|uniref:zinc ribbon domain-containing protein n=1 Tax=Rudaea sp. TaxID=2136325 RepID=UPI002ED0E67A
MSTCPQCGANVAADAHACAKCGVNLIFHYIPHPRIAERKERIPFSTRDCLPHNGVIQRFNAFVAVKITDGVGTMWCAYLFGILALISLPDAVRGGTATLVAWIAQTFLQLVLLSIIMVGQKVDGAASDKRAIETYDDASAVLQEAMQIQAHLAAQDKVLSQLTDEMRALRSS